MNIVLHGIIAVAELKLRMSNRENVSVIVVLHGIIAVAELKPNVRVVNFNDRIKFSTASSPWPN